MVNNLNSLKGRLLGWVPSGKVETSFIANGNGTLMQVTMESLCKHQQGRGPPTLSYKEFSVFVRSIMLGT